MPAGAGKGKKKKKKSTPRPPACLGLLRERTKRRSGRDLAAANKAESSCCFDSISRVAARKGGRGGGRAKENNETVRGPETPGNPSTQLSSPTVHGEEKKGGKKKKYLAPPCRPGTLVDTAVHPNKWPPKRKKTFTVSFPARRLERGSTPSTEKEEKKGGKNPSGKERPAGFARTCRSRRRGRVFLTTHGGPRPREEKKKSPGTRPG